MNKIKGFCQLSENDRHQIQALLQQGLSLSAIAAALGRAVSTISREVKRNSCSRKSYQAAFAHKQTARRHRVKAKRSVFDQQMKDFIARALAVERLSPELISVKGRRLIEHFISDEWIYRWIWKMKFSQARTDLIYRDLYRYLRHARRKRNRGNRRNMRGNILNRTWIDERPKEANERKRVGDLEADIVLGCNRKPGLLVTVDRRTRKAWIEKLITKDTAYVIQRLEKICRQCAKVKTITFDNDQSFAEHYRLHKLGIKTFFTHPYSSQEKGSVENRIGLIRMFFSKKTDFSKVTEEEIKKVQNILNQRPLRLFNYKTPEEKYKEYTFALMS